MIWLALCGVVIVSLIAWYFLASPQGESDATATKDPVEKTASAARTVTRKTPAPAPATATDRAADRTSGEPVERGTEDSDRKSTPVPSSAPTGARPSSRPSRPALPRLNLHTDPGDEEDGNTSLTMLGPVIDTSSQGSLRNMIPAAEAEEPTGLHSLVLVTAVAQTDKGLRRKHNEDSFLMLPDEGVFLVADGMGGHQAGEVASHVAAQTTAELFRSGQFPGQADPKLPRSADELRRAIVQSNEAIFQKAQSDGSLHGMGTTVVAARFSSTKRRACIAHVGDSRCYRWRDGSFEQLTTDHTIGSATGVAGSLGDRLTRALGIAASVSVDLLLDVTRPGDVYLLCSDGLSKMVADETIGSELADAADLPAVAQRLIDRANQSGGRDNITVVLVRVDPPAVR